MVDLLLTSDNIKSMEYIIALTSFLAGVGLTASIAGFVYFKAFKNMLNDVKNESAPDVYTANTPNVPTTQDQYTPDYATQTIPLENFIPNFDKPVRIKVEDTDDITPLD